jgi:hypothetical protein
LVEGALYLRLGAVGEAAHHGVEVAFRPSRLRRRNQLAHLDKSSPRSLNVLMPIETLGDALAAVWRVHARCLDGEVDYTHSRRKCHHQAELNLETLVWTRGRNMSLAGLRERMMCPRCGNRRVNLIFDPPSVAKRATTS